MNIRLVGMLCLILATVSAIAQSPWKITADRSSIQPKYTKPENFLSLDIDHNALINQVQRQSWIEIPNPDGEFTRFDIKETPVFSPGLAAKYPDYHSYSGRSGGDYLYMSTSPYGVHAMVLTENGSAYYIDPFELNDTERSIAYYKSDLRKPKKPFTCLTTSLEDHLESTIKERGSSLGDCTLRTYRLALACTGEYTQFIGGTKEKALAGFNASMTRVNGVYERDVAIRMILVDNVDMLIFLTASSDPYTNTNTFAMLQQNQTTCDNIIGFNNYDIGHVFGTGEGGVAQLQAPCGSSKAEGVTGRPAPVGDAFDIDYVAHEMGHQFGANHTQNNDCNRNDETAMEPGSGSTIMGYAGICDPDVASNSDAHFHTISIEEIFGFITSTSGNRCATQIEDTNTPPIASQVKAQYFIPVSTSFFLETSATDAENDILSYCWEQYDEEVASMPPKANNIIGPTFRSIPPKSSPRRYFPDLERKYPQWEVLPNVARSMNFKCVVRDNHLGKGCVDNIQTRVNLIAGTPFTVTYPNLAGVSWQVGTAQTVTWEKGNTTAAPISTPLVDIYLSTDGGKTYPHLIVAGVPNDGSHEIVTPSFPTNMAKIMVTGNENIFFDVSNNNFSITATFSMKTDKTRFDICDAKTLDIPVKFEKIAENTNPITLGTQGLPPTINATWSNNTISSLPEESNLTLSNLELLPEGLNKFTIEATRLPEILTLPIEIFKFSTNTDPIQLVKPISGSSNVAPQAIQLQWNEKPGIIQYIIEVAENPSFQTLVYSATLATTSTLVNLNSGKIYFWRVKDVNPCATTQWSQISLFRTSGGSSSSAILLKNEYLGLPSSTYKPINQSNIDVVTDDVAITYVGIQTLPSKGILRYNNTDVVVGQNLPLSEIIAGNFGYLNTSTDGDPSKDMFDFYIIDDKGRWLPNNKFNIIIAGNMLSGAAIVVNPILCVGDKATVKIEAYFGLPPYQYSLDNASFSPTQNVFTDLEPGSYPFYIKDNTNTVFTTNVITIAMPTPIVLGLSSDIYNINATVSGGKGNLSLSLNDTLTQSTPSFSDPGNGQHIVVATDELGCKVSDTINIDIPVLMATAPITDNIECFGQKGFVQVSATGGVPPYQYSLNGGTYVNNPNFSINAGKNVIAIRDKGGKIIKTDTIETNNPTQIMCAITSKKFVVTGIPSGGTPPYTYSSTGNTFDTNNAIEYPGNGGYKYYVKDSLNCTRVFNINLNVLESANITLRKTTCSDKTDGYARLTPVGGQTPFVYILNNDAPGSKREWTDLAPGTYAYTIVDARNDSIMGSFVVEASPLLTIDAMIQDDDVTLTAQGGTPPYSYSIDGSVFLLTNIFDNLTSGDYTFTVKDKNNCLSNVKVMLSNTENVLDEKVSIYPNPAQDYIDITFPSAYLTDDTKIELVAVDGRVVLSQIVQKNATHRLQIGSINSGSYLLKMINGTNQSHHKVQVLER